MVSTDCIGLSVLLSNARNLPCAMLLLFYGKDMHGQYKKFPLMAGYTTLLYIYTFAGFLREIIFRALQKPVIIHL